MKVQIDNEPYSIESFYTGFITNERGKRFEFTFIEMLNRDHDMSDYDITWMNDPENIDLDIKEAENFILKNFSSRDIQDYTVGPDNLLNAG